MSIAYWHEPLSPCAFAIPRYAPKSTLTAAHSDLGHSLDGSTVGDDDKHDLSPQHLPTRFLVALTCGIGGLQLIWSTLFSHGSSYLFTLGVSKSQSSLIWAAAPICGAIVQPLVGVMSDRSQSRWGRRRPFILGGAIAVAISLTALAWMEPLIGFACDGFQLHDQVARAAAPYGAVLALVLLNIAVQPLQFSIRALIVDTCPSEQQSIASAWAGRFTGLGNILAYVVGSLPLPFSFMLGEAETWRFRYMSLLSVAALLAAVLVTISHVHEEGAPKDVFIASDSESTGEQFTPATMIIGHVIAGWKAMTPRIRRVCRVQFYAWMGWFAFHFYSTSYISSLYLGGFQQRDIEITSSIADDGMRTATLASLFSAIAALGTTILLPHLTTPDGRRENSLPAKYSQESGEEGWGTQIETIWASSLVLYTLCTFSTLFITSSTAGTVLIALIGLSMGVTQWAPFAIIGEELASQHGDLEFGNHGADQSGAIMGIHNAVTSLPQVLAALVCSSVFGFAQWEDVGEQVATSWVLSLSGVAVLVAAWFAWKMGTRY